MSARTKSIKLTLKFDVTLTLPDDYSGEELEKKDEFIVSFLAEDEYGGELSMPQISRSADGNGNLRLEQEAIKLVVQATNTNPSEWSAFTQQGFVIKVVRRESKK